MNVFPTPEETDQAADLLINRYGISPQMLGKLFGTEQRDQANAILGQLGAGRLDRIDIARLLVIRQGSTLFSGSGEAIRGLRQRLLSRLPPEEISRLFEEHGPNGKHINNPAHMIKPLAKKKWHGGGPWPRDFVYALGFPEVFAGVVQRETSPTIEDFEPLKMPPKLVEFQKKLKEKCSKCWGAGATRLGAS